MKLVALLAFMTFFALAWMAAAALRDQPRLAIRVTPQVVGVGGTLRVTCRVRRDQANRWLEMGVVDYRSTGAQLDGDAARVTHEFFVDMVPCEASLAFCRLSGAGVELATLPIEVAGCGER